MAGGWQDSVPSGGWQDSGGDGGGTAVADGFDFDTQEADTDKVGGRGTVEKPGKYHFEIVDVRAKLDPIGDNGQPRTPSVLCTCRVLEAASGLSPAGSVTFHELYVGSKGGGKPAQGSLTAIVDFLYAAGVLRKVVTKAEHGERVQYINPFTNTTGCNLQTIERLKGEQFIGTIKAEKDDRDPSREPRMKIPFSGGCFRLDDPAVKDVPKNRDAVEIWNPPAGRGEVQFPGEAAGGANGSAATQQNGNGHSPAAPQATAPAAASAATGETKKRGRPRKDAAATPAPATPAASAAPAPSAAPPANPSATAPAVGGAMDDDPDF